MGAGVIGASIMNILTESLYDKPIVVFREYVQNAVDSFIKTKKETADDDKLECRIWLENKNLFFMDNGDGIGMEKFQTAMESIGHSEKTRRVYMGYKGIGRLSGISYCKRLTFVNFLDYKKSEWQIYTIDCAEYNRLKEQDMYIDMSFGDLMREIGTMSPQDKNIVDLIEQAMVHESVAFAERNTGFLVIMQEITSVLESKIKDKRFITELSWLLPVGFAEELYSSEHKEMFKRLENSKFKGVVPAQKFHIYFEENPIYRPISEKLLRYYTCVSEMTYAVVLHTFNQDKISVNNQNEFSGIKMYIDNMLLCDERELIPMLQQYGLLQHTTNELIQTVKGIGAMIYITDKVNIVANARRTFIEVTDDESLEFLRIIAEFIERIFTARYALSRYTNGKKNLEIKDSEVQNLRKNAVESLRNLAANEIEVKIDEEGNKVEFDNLTDTEKKRIIKKKITKELNLLIQKYMALAPELKPDNAYENFKIWLMSN